MTRLRERHHLAPSKEAPELRLSRSEPLLGRPVGQLAHNVWDESLASQVRAIAEHGAVGQRDVALAMVRAVEHKRQTLAGRITKDGR